MNAKKILLLFFTLPLLFLFNCGPKLDITLYHHADDQIDGQNYHTYEFYGWTNHSDSILTKANKQTIQNAFAEQFTLRDLTYVEQNGDLIVSLYLVTAEVMETKATTVYNGSGYGYGGYGGAGYAGYGYAGYGYGNYYGYGPGYGWGSYMSTSTIYSEVQHDEGTLIIDIYDAKQKILIYESVVIKNIDGSVISDARLRDLVARSMMYNFQVKPVEKKKKKK
jgi:hypothetical protein